jgi:hypothetical protein
MIGTFRAAAVAGGVVFAISNAAPGFAAQKHGGIPSNCRISILEDASKFL